MPIIVPFKAVYLFESILCKARCYIHLRWSCFLSFTFTFRNNCREENLLSGVKPSKEIWLNLKKWLKNFLTCMKSKTGCSNGWHGYFGKMRNCLFGGYRHSLAVTSSSTHNEQVKAWALYTLCSTQSKAGNLYLLSPQSSALKELAYRDLIPSDPIHPSTYGLEHSKPFYGDLRQPKADQADQCRRRQTTAVLAKSAKQIRTARKI